MFFSSEFLFQRIPSASLFAAGVVQDSVVAPFVRLGVEHIWTGYDHLLFLFALLAVCASFRASVRVISCFTLGHSLTLVLATLDWVNVPARFAEPLIAASIVYVGVENLVRRGAEPRGRGALTFGFGLIHGFGFASVLRELGVGVNGSGLALPLFSFNLGVELGQIAIAAVVLPLLWQLRKQEWFLRRGVPAISALVALAGLYWLVARTLLA
jgi:hydrogenase/urease accessory protein HupE